MLGKIISTVTRTAMETHTYQYKGDIYWQQDGGCIGNPLSSAVARVVMMDWDYQFLSITARIDARLQTLLNAVYKRYVDNQFGKHQATPPGYGWCPIEGVPVVSVEAMEEDRGKEDDKWTMLLLQNVANLINPRIVMTVNYPSAHEDKKMPVLDFKCWIGPT